MWRQAVRSEHLRLYFAAEAVSRDAPDALRAPLTRFREALGSPAAASPRRFGVLGEARLFLGGDEEGLGFCYTSTNQKYRYDE